MVAAVVAHCVLLHRHQPEHQYIAHSCYKLGIAFIYTFMYLWFLLSRCITLSTMSLCLELASASSSAASMAVLGRQLRSRRGTRTLRTVAGQQRITWLLVLGWARSIYTHTGHLIFMVSHSTA